MIYLGIDPGLTGAVTAIDERGIVVAGFDTPVAVIIRQTAKGPRRRSDPDVMAMLAELRSMTRGRDVAQVTLEKVQSMPRIPKKGAGGARDFGIAQDGRGQDEGWGALPNFQLGLGYGLWWGIVLSLGFRLERVAPIAWRSIMLRGLPAGKESGRLRACELFPAYADNLRLKKHHGRADSALLAEYGRRAASGALAASAIEVPF
mgnify:CR=1 FL=1